MLKNLLANPAGETKDPEERPDGDTRRRRTWTAPSTVRLDQEICLQHRSQGNRHSIFMPGLVLCVRRNGIVIPDALASGLAHREMVFLQGRPDDAGAVSGADDYARHDHGVYGADHGA